MPAGWGVAFHDVFERFTDRARRVLVLAQEEARLLHHNFIGTEHLLLGLIAERNGVAARALSDMDLSLEDVRQRIVETVGRPGAAPGGSPPFTPRSKKVLELSLREALSLGHNYIGTEHILLGVVREGECMAAQVLTSFGATEDEVRRRVMQLLGSTGAFPGAGRGPRLAPRLRPSEAVGPGGEAPGGEDAQSEPVRPRGVDVAAEGDRGSRRRPGWRRRQECSFCGRDLWAVDRYVWARAAICADCVALAQEALGAAEAESGRAVPFPPTRFGGMPDDDAVARITEAVGSTLGAPGLDEAALRTHVADADDSLWRATLEARRTLSSRPSSARLARVRFVDPDRAEVLCAVAMDDGSRLVQSGHAVRRGGRWMLERETFAAVLRQQGVRVDVLESPPGP